MGSIQSVTISSKYKNDKFSNEDLLDFAEMLYKSGMIKVNTTFNSKEDRTEMVYSMTLWLDDNQMKSIDMYNRACRTEEDEFKDMAEKCADTYHTMNGQMEDDNAQEKFEAFNDSIPYDTEKKVPWYRRIFEK
jgi:replicative DNA helicase